MRYDILPAAFMDSLRDKMIANNGHIPKEVVTGGQSFEDVEAGIGCADIHYTSGFAKAYIESWARLATAIGWVAGDVESDGGRNATVLLTNRKGEQFVLRSMTMFGCSADIGFKWLGGEDGTKRNMYDLLNGGSHSMTHRIEERLWYWVNRKPVARPYKMNEEYKKQHKYIMQKLDKIRKKNGLEQIK